MTCFVLFKITHLFINSRFFFQIKKINVYLPLKCLATGGLKVHHVCVIIKLIHFLNKAVSTRIMTKYKYANLKIDH